MPEAIIELIEDAQRSLGSRQFMKAWYGLVDF